METSREDLFGYSVRLSHLSEEDGGGWLAEVPELDGCISTGESPQQALTSVQDAIKCWLESAKEHGKDIPPPANHTEPEFSGEFTLRVPRALHRMLAKRAESEGVSLNHNIVSLISFGLGKEFGERSAEARETHASEARPQASYSIASEDRPFPAYRTSPSARSRTSAT
ncbi:MAG: toxin-antitoxin system HicB family antitoxin [Clostridia bacterium]